MRTSNASTVVGIRVVLTATLLVRPNDEQKLLVVFLMPTAFASTTRPKAPIPNCFPINTVKNDIKVLEIFVLLKQGNARVALFLILT